jgi:hypothetical protein
VAFSIYPSIGTYKEFRAFFATVAHALVYIYVFVPLACFHILLLLFRVDVYKEKGDGDSIKDFQVYIGVTSIIICNNIIKKIYIYSISAYFIMSEVTIFLMTILDNM